MGMVSSERIFKVLDNQEITPIGGDIIPERFKGNIEFKDVWFAYDFETNKDFPEWILKGISFKVNPGETVAFVGATGAGKSTIISLLNRFYEVSKGEILIDGISIKEYKTTELRKQISVVLQDIFLFSDSIKNNITLLNSEISDEEIKEASIKVGASVFIEKLPGKYDYKVQERGSVLSTGQRQLISFIRAFVYNPSILILDEATSSVDSETEELITEATNTITKNRTSIVIAHRLSTIQNADRIIVMSHGNIVEQGNHQKLIAEGGLYFQLFEVQFKHATA
jgi:ATP-binding cassette subfamily B protein